MRLGENPLLALITAITVILGGLNSFTGLLGLSPFWSDAVVTAALLYTLVYWWRAEAKSRRKAEAGMIDVARKRRVALGTLLVSAVLAALLVWNAAPLVAHLIAPRWQVCGAFSFRCDGAPCVSLYDSRKRPVSNECVALQDASGYVSLAAPNWWTYRPRHIAAVCGDATRRIVKLPAAFGTRVCDPVLELP